MLISLFLSVQCYAWTEYKQYNIGKIFSVSCWLLHVNEWWVASQELHMPPWQPAKLSMHCILSILICLANELFAYHQQTWTILTTMLCQKLAYSV